MLYVIFDRKDRGKEIHRFDSMKITCNADWSDIDDDSYSLTINEEQIKSVMSKNEIDMVTDLITKLISVGKDICIHESEIRDIVSYDKVYEKYNLGYFKFPEGGF